MMPHMHMWQHVRQVTRSAWVEECSQKRQVVWVLIGKSCHLHILHKGLPLSIVLA